MFDFDVISGPSPAERRRAQREAQLLRERRPETPRAVKDEAAPPASAVPPPLVER